MSHNGKATESVNLSTNLSSQLQAIATAVNNAVQDSQGDTISLLALLRQLEQLHQEIREGLFSKVYLITVKHSIPCCVISKLRGLALHRAHEVANFPQIFRTGTNCWQW